MKQNFYGLLLSFCLFSFSCGNTAHEYTKQGDLYSILSSTGKLDYALLKVLGIADHFRAKEHQSPIFESIPYPHLLKDSFIFTYRNLNPEIKPIVRFD